ncbi:MAG: VWA domain-containing protein [Spirochaetes bacterium]|nr:VWA domain-containing protein [Spirochaetota bacterium]MBU0954486.1 VWA domain-containing protein [Spirochaetota bacterium]
MSARRSRSFNPLPIAAVIVIIALVALFNILGGGGSGNVKASESSGYTLQFSEAFKPALANRDDLGISVVLAVDVSGSMSDWPASGGNAKYVQASQALVEVMEVLERIVAASPEGQVIKLGIIKFSDALFEIQPLVVISKASMPKLKALVGNPKNFAPGGGTAIGDAIERGTEWLAQSGTILRSLIVVSDGQNTAGTDPEDVLEAVYANRNSAGTADFPVRTNTTLISFIGFDIDRGYFGGMQDYGVRVTGAANRAELATVLSNLLEADITRLEAAALGSGK